MATASFPSDRFDGDSAGTQTANEASDGRPMFGLALGLCISVPLWAGLWCVSGWI